MNNKIKANEPSWAGLIIFILATLFILYKTIPNIALSLSNDRTKAKINRIEDEYLKFEYKIPDDTTTYSFSKRISKDQSDYIKRKKSLYIEYSPYFPDNPVISNLDKKKPVIVFIIIYTVIIISIARFVKLVRTK